MILNSCSYSAATRVTRAAAVPDVFQPAAPEAPRDTTPDASRQTPPDEGGQPAPGGPREAAPDSFSTDRLSFLFEGRDPRVEPRQAGELVETAVGTSGVFQVYEKDRGQLRVFAYDAAGAESGQRAVSSGWPKFSAVDGQGNLVLFTSGCIHGIRPDGAEAFQVSYPTGFLATGPVGSLRPHVDAGDRVWFLNLEGRVDCLDARSGKLAEVPEAFRGLDLQSFGPAGPEAGLGSQYNQVFRLDFKTGTVRKLPDLPFLPMNQVDVSPGGTRSVRATVGSGQVGELRGLPDGSVSLRATVITEAGGGIAGGPRWSSRIYVLPPRGRSWRVTELPEGQGTCHAVHPDGSVLYTRPYQSWVDRLAVHELVRAVPGKKAIRVVGTLTAREEPRQVEVNPANGHVYLRAGNTIAEFGPQGDSALSLLDPEPDPRSRFGSVELAGFLPSGQVAVGHRGRSELNLLDPDLQGLVTGHVVARSWREQLSARPAPSPTGVRMEGDQVVVGGVRLKVRSSAPT